MVASTVVLESVVFGEVESDQKEIQGSPGLQKVTEIRYLRVTWRCWETSGDIQKILVGSLENAGASTQHTLRDP